MANEYYGFLTELHMKYPRHATRLYREFNIVFSKMPIAAIINSKYFAVHGGIPKGYGMKDIERIEKGDVEGLSNPLIQLLWNDPDETIDYFEQSPRGPDIYLYGEKAFDEFMENAGLEKLFRAHTFLLQGAKWFFKNRLLSIFSCIEYTGYTVEGKIAKIKNDEIKIIDLKQI